MLKTEIDHEPPRPRFRRLGIVGAVLALALLAAACGSSSDQVDAADGDAAASAAATDTADSGGSSGESAPSDDTGGSSDGSATTDAATSGDSATTDAATSGNTGSTGDTGSTAGDSETTGEDTTTDTPTETAPADPPESSTTSSAPTSSTTSTSTTSTTTTTSTSTTTAPAGPPIAPFDNDSANNPAQSVFMSITGTRTLTHTDEISWSGGDNEDFVEFELPNASNSSQQLQSLSLTCTLDGTVGNAVMAAELLQDGSRVTQGLVQCGDAPTRPTIDNTKPALVRIYFQITNEGVHGDYTLTVQAF